jgi:hypothetical protein
MSRAILTLKIKDSHDMAQLEKTVGALMGGENHKCAFVRSRDFVLLRLRALYNRPATLPKGGLVVYGEGLKICLDCENNVSVYLTGHIIDIEPEEPLLGKRKCQDDDAVQGLVPDD